MRMTLCDALSERPRWVLYRADPAHYMSSDLLVETSPCESYAMQCSGSKGGAKQITHAHTLSLPSSSMRRLRRRGSCTRLYAERSTPVAVAAAQGASKFPAQAATIIGRLFARSSGKALAPRHLQSLCPEKMFNAT